VVAGQQAENLLDFDADDEPAANGDQLNNTNMGMGMISSQQIASAAKASNPLDELMDLFSSANMSTPAQTPGAPVALMNPSTSRDSITAPPPPFSSNPAQAAPAKKQEEDLLGLF